VVQLHRKIDQLHAAGAELVIIGNGAPMFIAGFRERSGYKGPLYTDPSLATYKAAHLGRGFGKTFNPLSIGATVKAFAHGSRQRGVEGDAYQQGGVVVIAPGGVVKWHHISKRLGDNATMEQIVASLKAA
jgi:hypothetical protein